MDVHVATAREAARLEQHAHDELELCDAAAVDVQLAQQIHQSRPIELPHGKLWARGHDEWQMHRSERSVRTMAGWASLTMARAWLVCKLSFCRERLSVIAATSRQAAAYGALEVLVTQQQRAPLGAQGVAVGDERPEKDDRKEDVDLAWW